MINKPDYRGISIDKGDLSLFAIWIISERKRGGVCWENYEDFWSKTDVKSIRASEKEISFTRESPKTGLYLGRGLVSYKGKRTEGLNLFEGTWKGESVEKKAIEGTFYLIDFREELPMFKLANKKKVPGFDSIIPHLLSIFDSRLEKHLQSLIKEYSSISTTHQK